MIKIKAKRNLQKNIQKLKGKGKILVPYISHFKFKFKDGNLDQLIMKDNSNLDLPRERGNTRKFVWQSLLDDAIWYYVYSIADMCDNP